MLKSTFKKLRRRFTPDNMGDTRSKRNMAVIESILNQNARDRSAATFPVVSWPVVELCNEFDVGIMQIPCPEINALGFDRKQERSQTIRDALDTPGGRDTCRFDRQN